MNRKCHVDYSLIICVIVLGVFISGAASNADDMDVSSHRGRKGLQINPSSNLKIYCALPASMVIVVPLTAAAVPPPYVPATPDEKTDESGTSESVAAAAAAGADGDDKESGDKDRAEDDSSKETIQRTKSSGSDVGSAAPSTAALMSKLSIASVPQTSFQWIGDTSGEINDIFMEFLHTLPADATSFRICFSCVDRMTRDTLALSCRTLVGFDSGMPPSLTIIYFSFFAQCIIQHVYYQYSWYI
jgi:hypothetical protein